MSVKLSKLDQLEVGLYKDAKNQGMSLSVMLEQWAKKGEISEDLVKPEAKNSQGKTLTAFQQILASAGIRTKGQFAQTGEAFFTDQSKKVLFPEFLANEYRDAERDLPPVFLQLTDLVTNREGIRGNSHKVGMMAAPADGELEFGRVAEGAALPRYTVKQAERAVDIYKYGGMLDMTYEAIRQAALPMLSRYIGKIARAQVKRKIKMALAVALNGDGNFNPAPNSPTRAAALSFADLIDLHFEAAGMSVETSLIIGDSTMISALIALYTLTTDGRPADRNVPFTASGGALPAPLGMMLKLTLPGSQLEGSDKLMAIDSRDGLVEIFEENSEITESTRLIETQFERVTFSENLGYGKPETFAFRTKTLAA